MEKKQLLYSDEWQDYKGDYDKQEYDVMLEDGTVVANCYPNGGIFNSLSTKDYVKEKDVVKIRYSEVPVTELNEGISEFFIEEEYNKRLAEYEMRVASESVYPYHHYLGGMDGMRSFIYANDYPLPKRNKKIPSCITPRPVDTSTLSSPKIGRNHLCSCESGKKYKKCCLSN